MATRPARQICPVCGLDDDVLLTGVGVEWIMTCSNPRHPLYEWRPTEQARGLHTYRSGIGEELGVYDDLLACVTEGLAEYGVIEHRFAERARDTYDTLVRRYGHTALGPSRYTASSFLGGALGQLWREDLVTGLWGPATGYWAYNGQVGAYGPAGTPESERILTWALFAEETLGLDPASWPALGYVPS